MQWQEQVAIPQEKGGAFFHLLKGGIQTGFSVTEDSPARGGVRLSPLSNVTRDFVVKRERERAHRKEAEGPLAPTSFCTQPA